MHFNVVNFVITQVVIELGDVIDKHVTSIFPHFYEQLFVYVIAH